MHIFVLYTQIYIEREICRPKYHTQHAKHEKNGALVFCVSTYGLTKAPGASYETVHRREMVCWLLNRT